MFVSIPLTKEMIAAGLEAMRAAKADCLEEADIVTEIYLAMYGTSLFLEPETVH